MKGHSLKGKELKLRFSMLYFLTCSAMACYYPFNVLYYQSRHLDYSQIGKLFAINSLVSVIAQPLWGVVTDKYLDKKKTILIVLVASATVVLGFTYTKSFPAIVLWVMLFMAFQSPILSLNDAYCYEAIETDKSLQYGRLRLMGSIGYALAALGVAILVEKTKIESSFYVYAVFGVFSILILLGIRVKGKSSGNSLDLSDVAEILKNPKFLILSLSAMLISACMGANGSYLAILIQKTGGSVSNVGLLWFVVAISELPAFFFGTKLIRKYGTLNIYYIGLIFYSTRFLLDSLCVSYEMVILLQLMQAITYPLYVMSTLQHVNSIVPVKARTTAITMFAAMTSGVGGFLGNILGAKVIEGFSVFLLFRGMAVVVIVALVIGLMLRTVGKDKIVIAD